MSQSMAMAIALAVTPLMVFVLRLLSRTLVEWAYWKSPPGRFRNLLARDRASRTKRG
jgi:hypothetical protein